MFDFMAQKVGVFVLNVVFYGEKEDKHMKKLLGVLFLAVMVVFVYAAVPAIAEEEVGPSIALGNHAVKGS